MPVATYRVRRIPKDPEPEPLHEYSSTQVSLSGLPVEILRKMQHSIQPADIGPEGLEEQPHVTVKFGLHFQTPSAKLRAALKTFGPVTLTLGKTSLFKNEDADVLKVDVESDDLRRLNKLISRLVPTFDTHPKYIPHMTVGYLRPGRGAKYAGDKSLDGQKLTFNSIVFSGKRGHRETLPLGAASPGPYRVR